MPLKFDLHLIATGLRKMRTSLEKVWELFPKNQGLIADIRKDEHNFKNAGTENSEEKITLHGDENRTGTEVIRDLKVKIPRTVLLSEISRKPDKTYENYYMPNTTQQKQTFSSSAASAMTVLPGDPRSTNEPISHPNEQAVIASWHQAATGSVFRNS